MRTAPRLARFLLTSLLLVANLQKTKGGVILPEVAKGKVPEGTVIAAGPGVRNQVCSMKGASCV